MQSSLVTDSFNFSLYFPHEILSNFLVDTLIHIQTIPNKLF